MLIDASYFAAGVRQIANCTLGKGTTQEIYTVNMYIAEYQEQFLVGALGEKVGMQVLSYIEQVDADPQTERIAELDDLIAKIRKPFADFVYFSILRDSATQATVTGTVRLKGSNEHVSPMQRQVTAWNRMANSLNLLSEWVESGECPVEGVVTDENLLTPINQFNI